LQGARARTTGTADPALWKFPRLFPCDHAGKSLFFIYLEQRKPALRWKIREACENRRTFFQGWQEKPSLPAGRNSRCGKI